MTHPHRSITHKERFLHLNPELGLSDKYSAATVFARQEHDDGNWWASVALCWRIDQFCRATGRKNARRHYFENKHVYCLGKEFKQQNLINFALDKAKGKL